MKVQWQVTRHKAQPIALNNELKVAVQTRIPFINRAASIYRRG
jgi:hypothetical protein